MTAREDAEKGLLAWLEYATGGLPRDVWLTMTAKVRTVTNDQGVVVGYLIDNPIVTERVIDTRGGGGR